MTESKPWYLSRTIWASLITIVTAAAGIFGVPVTGLDNAALTDTLCRRLPRSQAWSRFSAEWARRRRLGDK